MAVTSTVAAHQRRPLCRRPLALIDRRRRLDDHHRGRFRFAEFALRQCRNDRDNQSVLDLSGDRACHKRPKASGEARHPRRDLGGDPVRAGPLLLSLYEDRVQLRVVSVRHALRA